MSGFYLDLTMQILPQVLFCTFYFFIWTRPRKCEPKDSSRGGSTAQNQLNQAKVTAPKHLKFRSSLFKGLQGRGTASSSLPQERNTPAHSNSESKINSKAKQNEKIKKRNAAKKCWYDRCNVSYNLK